MRWKTKDHFEVTHHAFAFLPHKAKDGYTYWLQWVKVDFITICDEFCGGVNYIDWLGDSDGRGQMETNSQEIRYGVE